LDSAILQRGCPEIQEQAYLFAGKTQVGEYLGLMHGIQAIHRFGFHHDLVIHQQVDWTKPLRGRGDQRPSSLIAQ
jgi:hypothetical protein